MQYDKKSGQVDQPILQTSKVVSLEEFRDRKTIKVGLLSIRASI
jgi:hypothetical protein